MSDADGVLLPEGTRLVHIGPHKTGTTAVQRAFHLNREATAAHGVVYAGDGLQPYTEVRSLMPGAGRLGSRRAPVESWDRLVASIDAAGEDRVVLSCESLDGAVPETVERIRDDLGPDRVHVVRMVRRLDRLLPSSWQQSLTNGRQQTYLRWMDQVFSNPDHAFWERQDYERLTMRWADSVGPENVTVVVVDESDRRWLLDVFEDMTGLPRGTLKAGNSPDNLSLSPGGAAAIRRVNKAANERRWAAETHLRLIRSAAVRGLKLPAPAAGLPRLAIPERWVGAVVEASHRNVEALTQLPVRIVGDPGMLRLSADDVPALPDDALRERFATCSPLAVANGAAAVVERARKGRPTPVVADPEGDAAALKHLRLPDSDAYGRVDAAKLLVRSLRPRPSRAAVPGAGVASSVVRPAVRPISTRTVLLYVGAKTGTRRVSEALARALPETAVGAEVVSVDLAEDVTAALDRAAGQPGRPVHVLLTLDLPARAATRGWQRHVESGGTDPFEEWIAGSSCRPQADVARSVRPELRYDEIVRRWVEAVGPEHVTVAVADGGDTVALRVVEALLDAPTGTIEAGGTPGRDLALAELEIVRELNLLAKVSGWSSADRTRFVVGGALEALRSRKPAAGEQPPALPDWAHAQIAAASRAAVDDLGGHGVTVVGRVDDLLLGPQTGPVTDATPEASAAMAAAALVGVIESASVPEVDDARRQAWHARERRDAPSVRDVLARLNPRHAGVSSSH